ncbi:SDR family NAD(P)-dependent oxidoreductase, partial [Nocardia sp. NPDC060220]
MNRLDNHRTLVTGAASGIGAATALRLLDEGARVVAADVSAEGLAATSAQAAERGTADRLTTLTIDIGDEQSVIEG